MIKIQQAYDDVPNQNSGVVELGPEWRTANLREGDRVRLIVDPERHGFVASITADGICAVYFYDEGVLADTSSSAVSASSLVLLGFSGNLAVSYRHQWSDEFIRFIAIQRGV